MDKGLFDVICRLVLTTDNLNKKILDVGCGDMGSDVLKKYISNFLFTEVTNLDLRHSYLLRLNKKRKVCGDATNMPFKDKYFDIVFALYIPYERETDLFDVAKEACRVLNNDGLFIFTDHFSMGTDEKEKLSRIGFRDLTHILSKTGVSGFTDHYTIRRTIDTYVAMK